jgi:hypothetical protein
MFPGDILLSIDLFSPSHQNPHDLREWDALPALLTVAGIQSIFVMLKWHLISYDTEQRRSDLTSEDAESLLGLSFKGALFLYYLISE